MCYYELTSIHILVFQFSHAELFLLKALPTFFSNAVKTENLCRIQILEILEAFFFFRLYTCNIYVVRTSASDFKQLYIFYNFHPIKQISWSGIIAYLTRIFNYLGQTQLYITISVRRVSLKTKA